MKTWNWTQMERMKTALLAVVFCLALTASAPAQAKPDVPVVVDAMTKAKEAPTAEGRWVVTAKVMMYSYTRGVGFTNKMDATGLLTAKPDSTDELSGTLGMRLDDGPYFTHKLRLHVSRDGKVGIQWLIKNKPFLAREMKFFQAEAVGKDSLAARGIDWNGLKRTLIVTLSSQRVKASAPPAIRLPSAKPIGKRYKITGRLVVTNSSDGIGDNTVEITGVLLLSQRAPGRKGGWMPDRPFVTIIPQPLGKNASLPADQNIFVDHIFANPKTSHIQLRSLIYDDDDFEDDPMNIGDTRLRSLSSLADGKEHVLPGDRDSENVEVYYNVTFVEDLY